MFRTIARKVVPALAVAGIAFGAAAPANAYLIDTDTVLLSGNPVDFGDNWTLGTPLTGGKVTWDLKAGKVTPKLTGKIYLNNAAGKCARMQMSFYNEGGALLATKNGGTVCANDNKLHSWGVNLAPFSHQDTVKVVVRTQLQNTSGAFGNVSSKTVVLS